MYELFTYILLISLLILLSYILRTNRKPWQRSPRLPQGSMGWPYIGETLQLYSQDPNVFFAQKLKRYGEIFKTHILGCPCVVMASPEATKLVLATQAHLFKPTYPKSKETLIGPFALFFHQGEYHKCVRKMVLASLSRESVCALLSGVEEIALSTLESWGGGHVINTFHEMKKFSFEVGILAIFGHLDGGYRQELKKNYSLIDKGYNSYPLKFPGSRFKTALLARQRLRDIIEEIIQKRKETRSDEKNLLGHLLNSRDERGNVLSEDQIGDNVIGVLFAAQDTTASVLTWVFKYLHDNPKLLEQVKEEQMAVFQSNNGGQKPLTWAQTTSMSLTHKVILETLRMSSIISFTYREAVADVEFKGYVIPKGWKVLPLFRNIHHNPDFFQDPQKFDPSRFEVGWKPNTYMPFGSGVHACPGNKLVKLEMLVMIHHLVTKFRWEAVGSQTGVQYSPFPVPMQGFPARFWKEDRS